MKFEEIRILALNSVLTQTPETYHISTSELENFVKSEKFKYEQKLNRHAFMQTFASHRTKQELSEYATFNGLQPLDIDFKNDESASRAKPILAKFLFKYHWVRAICYSTSGNGLHVYTYHEPQKQSVDNDLEHLKESYLLAYEYKMIILWKALVLSYQELQKDKTISSQALRDIHPELNTSSITKRSKYPNVVDAALAKISQAMFITADKDLLINDNFDFTTLDIQQEEIDKLYEDNQTFDLSRLKRSFDFALNRFDDSSNDENLLKKENIDILGFGDTTTITPQNYNNEERYRLAYTLANIHDVRPDSGHYKLIESIFLQMCRGNPKYEREKSQWAASFRSAAQRNSTGTSPIIWWAIKELKTKHGYKIDTKNFKETTNREIILEHNTEDKIADSILTDVVIDHVFRLPISDEIHLKSDEYIGTVSETLLSTFKLGLNYLMARPGLGKTEFIKMLTRSGLRVMLIQPYTSIITSKIENSDLLMECFYGDKRVDLSNDAVCMTFDKFCTIDTDEASMLFDIVAIDESHLLTCSSYRGLVPANVIDIAKKLKTKVVMMSGTPIAEHLFCDFKSMTRIDKPSKYEKQTSFIVAQDSNEKLSKICKHIANTLSDGGKILFPTNNGNEYIERIVGGITSFLKRKPKYKYYKKENSFYEFVDKINSDGTLGDVEILFCTNYLSVGIDINDTCKFDIIYDEKFTAQEIEQFNSRLRKLDLRSFVYFDKFFLDGEPKNLTAYDPLDLTITQQEKLEFADVFRLHTENKNPQSYYDFFRWAFRQPYFVFDKHTGETTLHSTAYKLHEFEKRWRVWSLQLQVISTNLRSLGYKIYYSDEAQTLEQSEIFEAAQAAKLAAQAHRAKKNAHIENMLELIESHASFKTFIEIRRSNVIDSDKWGFVKLKDEIGLLVGDRNIYDEWSSMLYQLSKYYTYDVIIALVYEHCSNNDKIVASKLRRYITAIRFFSNARDKNLVKSNVFIAKHIFNKFETEEIALSVDELDTLMSEIADLYIEHEEVEARSTAFKQRLIQKAHQLWNIITVRHDKFTFSLLRIPRFNTQFAQKRKNIMQIFDMMFDDDIFSAVTQLALEQNEVSRKVSMQILEEIDEPTELDILSDYTSNDEKFDVDSIREFDEALDSKYFNEHKNSSNSKLRKAATIQIEKEEKRVYDNDEYSKEISNVNIDDDDLFNILKDLED